LCFEISLALDLLFQSTAILQQLLCGFLIVPEIRRRRLRFDPAQFFTAGRNIKETSRAARRAREGCRT
jgi:hypothetical protein